MPDFTSEALTAAGAVIATVIGGVMAEFLRRSADRRADQRANDDRLYAERRANRDRLYAERRTIYPEVLAHLREAPQNNVFAWERHVGRQLEKLTLIGSSEVRQAVAHLRWVVLPFLFKPKDEVTRSG